ncbi:ADP-ribosylglycohydrolase family protein [Desulfohalovibrio reitneri]|uniref:ADP-ribosylglycohydrolase family protein n=1 Tax=Desulfohalovibrio reitneri TaxID=1307759 RepID=UPI0004A77E23|nr:ADP-ribosylglycohydrolase family protein [Desulfohalovibrio reitneri]
MPENRKAAVLAAFAGDSLALGAHWIYDADSIKERFGRVDEFMDPPEDSHHKNRTRGQFTHYGDQMLILLESCSRMGGFEPADFSSRWQDLMRDYDGYMDQASRKTMANLGEGAPPYEAGSDSSDLAGAARMAPLLYFIQDADSLAAAAKEQCRLTHNNPRVLAAAQCLAHAVCKTLEGARPREALIEAAALKPEGIDLTPFVNKGLESLEENTAQAVRRLGSHCHLEGAFPAVVHLAVKYQDRPAEALVQSVMAGGDSAARNAALGLLLGAHHGMGFLPQSWLDGMEASARIHRLLG